MFENKNKLHNFAVRCGTVELGLSNSYGNVITYKLRDKHYIELGDYSGSQTNEISEEFYNAIIKEFVADE